jgi:hypothetical protein
MSRDEADQITAELTARQWPAGAARLRVGASVYLH